MDLEFRSSADDAWYQVKIATDHSVGRDRLRVKFVGFPSDHDEDYYADELTSFRDVEDFKARFRPVSIQVQDSQCRKVVRGTLVCAAISTNGHDCRFYDAVVHQVVRDEHFLVKGKEECSCSYILYWRHGPKARSLTTQTLENICRVKALVGKLDPLLTSFLVKAKKSIEGILFRINDRHEAVHHLEPCTPNCREELSGSKRLNKCSSFSGRSSDHSLSRKEMVCSPSKNTERDMNVGATPYMLLVENLEKGLSPLSIMEFIHQQVTISCQACVWPSKSIETFTRGTIVVDSKINLDKLSNFLENPGHLIISSKGRPWVLTEKSALHETARASIRGSMLMSETILKKRIPASSNVLKVVISGTEEYETAKVLKDLFTEFLKRQDRLHRKLLLLERDLSHLSDAMRR